MSAMTLQIQTPSPTKLIVDADETTMSLDIPPPIVGAPVDGSDVLEMDVGGTTEIVFEGAEIRSIS